MGQTVWRYVTDYQADVGAALRALQNEVFAQRRFHCVYADKPQALASIAGAIASCRVGKHAASGLNQHLVGLWQEELERIRGLPDPQTPEEAIEQQRLFCAEAGTCSILDMRGVAEHPEMYKVAPFTPAELRRIFRTEKPTWEEVEALAGRLPPISDEWRGYYFTIYKDGQPDKLCFYGSSGD